ncbi:transglycosylase SLT domain-containing protein [Sphingomonas sp. GCM10030256]|uniref:lytic transglycosylase domain-containing protein n=1 Tax=Sphingomonas sp. GCM10030256 TaxID=3273427 RepID=UPI00360ED658
MSIILGLSAIASLASQPANDPLAPVPEDVVASEPVEQQPAPPLGQPVVMQVPRDWRGVFDAIRAGQWAAAQAGIAALPASPLAAVARAELYTAKGSPPVELGPLLNLLAEAPELPEAAQLRRLAESRGALDLPRIAPAYPVVQIGASPRRQRARPVTGEPEADRLRADLEPFVKADDAVGAEYLLMERMPLLSAEARAEAAQRVAWIYYVTGQDAHARRVSETGRTGALGEWAVQGAWVSAMASWRQNDCEFASRLFLEVGQRATEPSLAAGGYYWAARSEMACRRPAGVANLMRAAARNPETFYGLLARRTLGMGVSVAPLPAAAATHLDTLPNVRRAAELVRIGERDLAGQYLRHQARIGNPADQTALVAVARRLELPATQHWLAHFGRPGARVPSAARYPQPSWAPRSGWRIDPALPLAHALQETSFRSEAVSPAGAVGLMQIMPGTMTTLSRLRGIPAGNLKDPAVNMEFGQAWIEMMRGHPATGGQLPKVIASYNAGSIPVGRWQVNDKGDPLLWIESIPYWETRYYVPTVLRNLWIYESLSGAQTPTLTSMAQHRWPAFPVARR